MCQQILDLTDKPLQQQSCTSRKDTDKETDNENKLVVCHVSATPTEHKG